MHENTKFAILGNSLAQLLKFLVQANGDDNNVDNDNDNDNDNDICKQHSLGLQTTKFSALISCSQY